MNSAVKNIIFWVVMIATALLLWLVVSSQRGGRVEQPTFTQFMEEVENGNVREVTLVGNNVRGTYKKGNTQFRSTVPSDYPDLIKGLREQGVNITVKEDSGSSWVTWVANGLPMILLLGLWIFFMRQMQSGGNKALSFGEKPRAASSRINRRRSTFKDVAGVEEAQEELQEIIEFLRETAEIPEARRANPQRRAPGRATGNRQDSAGPGYCRRGQRAFLFHLRLRLRRDVRGRGEPPACATCSTKARRTRLALSSSMKSMPSAVIEARGLGGGHDEREQTLNQLLVEMDGFESNDGVILISATNRPDVLDPALLRPGRFDRRVVVARPDVGGRGGILRVHTKKIPLSEDVDVSVLARGTPGFSGADLANLVNEAALMAARYNRKHVSMRDFENSKDKVLMGAERKSLILSEEEKKNTAFHEAGHALVAEMMAHADPLHKVTIIPRGMALGVTMTLPVDDKHTYTKDFLEDQLAIMMGGRVAEELFLDHITTGAGNDIEQATELAHRMVCEYGMSGTGTPFVWKESGSGVPRPRHRHAQGIQRGYGDPYRPAGKKDCYEGLRSGSESPDFAPAGLDQDRRNAP